MLYSDNGDDYVIAHTHKRQMVSTVINVIK